MAARECDVLPTDEELTVQEINLTFPVLQAAAFHLGKYCDRKLRKEAKKNPKSSKF